jgi:RHS repeat-associated protein
VIAASTETAQPFPAFLAPPPNARPLPGTHVYLLENSRLGLAAFVTAQQPGFPSANRQNALGIPATVRQTRVGSRCSGKERDVETGLDYFQARYFSSAQGRFTSPDEFKGGIVDAFTNKDIETNTALPYADITNPQSLNKYGYVLNNPLRYIDPDGHAEHEGAFSLVQDWLDVVEVRGSAGVGAGAGGQCGAAEFRAEYTLIGVEGKSGLGGGNAEGKVLTQFKVAGKVGDVGGEAKLTAEASTRTGMGAELKGEAQAGPASTAVGVKAGPGGLQPVSNTKATTDIKLGVDLKVGVGVGVGVNFSQVGRAYGNTAQAVKTTVQTVSDYLIDKVKSLTPWKQQ